MVARKHEREHFFKYTSYDTAIKVIDTLSFRWRNPTTFNDPFDYQTGFTFGYDENTFSEQLKASFTRMLYSDELTVKEPKSAFAKLINIVRDKYKAHPEINPLNYIESGFQDSSKRFTETFNNLNTLVKEVLTQSVVFCVSDKDDNVVMWSHYADEHKGVVFRLGCIDEIDNTLLAARQIDYSNEFVPFPNAEKYAMHLTEEKPLNIPMLAWDIAFRKHKDWSYENEWRIHMPLQSHELGCEFIDYIENSKVFEAIYLGCRMEEQNKQDIIKLARAKLPHIKIYQAEKSKTTFELKFNQL